MKKLILLAALLFVSTAAVAEEAKAPPAEGGKMERSADHEKNFAEHKAKILKRMEEHQAEAQKRKACVDAAKDPEALKACRPKHGPKPEGHEEGHEGPGHDGPEHEDDTPPGQ